MRRRYLVPVLVGVLALLGALLSLALAGSPSGDMARASGLGREAQVKRDTDVAPAARPDPVGEALPSAPGISGRLLANGTPAPDQRVRLRQYGVGSDTPVMTTTTSISGFYEFANPPTPPTGLTYYVQYGPQNTNPNYVYVWFGADITGYTQGQTRSLGDLNIADVALVAPADGAVLGFPVTFRWTPRPDSDTDSYRLIIYDQDTGSGWMSPPLGRASSFTIDSAADLEGVVLGKTYYWYLRIDDSVANNSYGLGFAEHAITFSGGQQATATATGTATATRTATATHTPGPSPTPTATRAPGEEDFLLFLPLIERQAPAPVAPPGVLSGRVVDATNAQPLAGVTVAVVGTGLSTTTNATGNYSFPAVPSGNRQVTASRSGFVIATQTINILRHTPNTLNFALSPVQQVGEMRLVLEWGERPEDLDSHLWLPPSQPYHVYWNDSRGSLTSFPFAFLDVDDVDSFGPETITIRQRYPGQDIYAIYNYSGEAPLGGSGARVTVYTGATQFGTYTVPQGSGDWWVLLRIDGATGQITVVNQLTNACPSSYSCVAKMRPR